MSREKVEICAERVYAYTLYVCLQILRKHLDRTRADAFPRELFGILFSREHEVDKDAHIPYTRHASIV